MKNHMLWMIIGCVVPMLLIFILPAFGVSGGVTLVIFIVLMFARRSRTMQVICGGRSLA